MKIKFFILFVLFMGIGAMSYAQSQASAPAVTKDAPAQVKSTGCEGHQTAVGKADCKWVDANGDGKCDSCGKTEKECAEACKAVVPKAAASGCQYQKECGKEAEKCTSKDGKK